MIEIDPKDAHTRAQVLVGRFMFFWGAMEAELNRATGKALDLKLSQRFIVTRNMQLRSKLHTLAALIKIIGVNAAGQRILDALIEIGNLSDTSRNIVAHEAFWPSEDGDGVEFARVQARGELKFPDTIWKEADFVEKYDRLIALAGVLEKDIDTAMPQQALANALANYRSTGGLFGLGDFLSANTPLPLRSPSATPQIEDEEIHLGPKTIPRTPE